MLIVAFAISKGPSAARRSPDCSLKIVDKTPLATCVPPSASAHPATPPSAALVIRFKVSPRESDCMRVLADSYTACLPSRDIRREGELFHRTLQDLVLCLTIRRCDEEDLEASNEQADRRRDRQL